MPLFFFSFYGFITLRRCDGKFGGGANEEEIDDTFYEMTEDKGGFDITKVEWKLEMTSVDSKKGPKGKSSTVRFLGGKNPTDGKVALFSTGEVGSWTFIQPNKEVSFEGTPVTPRLVNTSYDEALKASNINIEIEVPSTQKGDKSMIVYNFPIGAGNVQSMAAVVRGKGTVKYYPKRKATSDLLSLDGFGDDLYAEGAKDDGIDVGTASMRLKGGKPLVDKSWAKGRRWFWTRREQPGMKHPGYI